MKTITIFLVLFVFGASQVCSQFNTNLTKNVIEAVKNHTSNVIVPTTRIINGTPVTGRQFPGTISLQVKRDHECGGSIVNANYVVTAAHCCQFQLKDLTILSGTNSLDEGGVLHTVTEIHVHDHYNHSDPAKHNDICIVKVDPPFVFDDNTAAVTLPQQGQVTPAGTSSIIVGWGQTEHGTYSQDLRMVDVTIYNFEECVRLYQEVDDVTLIPEQICTSTEGHRGVCTADSGGPLFVNGEVRGLVSGGKDCAVTNLPQVFTRVSGYIDWINSKVTS